MIHVKKTTMKKEAEKLVEKKVTEPVAKSVAPTKEEKIVESKPTKEKKEVVTEETYNGLHAYSLTYMQKNVVKKAFVIARTEKSALHRVNNELSGISNVQIKRIADDEGHKIIKKAGKAGIFPVTA